MKTVPTNPGFAPLPDQFIVASSMTAKKQPPKPAQGREERPPFHERGLNILDVTSTWLAVAHLGALAFLYNAVLSGRIAFDEPKRQLACIFIAGAVSAFLAKTLTALYFINGEWPYRKL